jgi:hypothetical protein
VRLVGLHAAVPPQEGPQGASLQAQLPAGALRVEDVAQEEARVALQPGHVRGPAVEDLENDGVGEERGQEVHAAAQGGHVDEVVD